MRAVRIGAAIAAAMLTAAIAQADPALKTPPALAVAAPKAACTLLAPSEIRLPDVRVETHTDEARRYFAVRLDQFAKAPLECGKIIMLGDSLTEQNDWTKSVKASADVRNRGISGDTSDGVRLRLAEITASRPRAVFLMIGTNDLYTENSPRTTVANISRIVDELRRENPQTKVFVQTLLPVNFEPSPNGKVVAINALLKLAASRSEFTLLDTNVYFTDRAGKLKAAYTDDGLHLNRKGYRIWSQLISATLRQHGLVEEKTRPAKRD
jgi:lysophospholipase L1-like esterase